MSTTNASTAPTSFVLQLSNDTDASIPLSSQWRIAVSCKSVGITKPTWGHEIFGAWPPADCYVCWVIDTAERNRRPPDFGMMQNGGVTREEIPPGGAYSHEYLLTDTLCDAPGRYEVYALLMRRGVEMARSPVVRFAVAREQGQPSAERRRIAVPIHIGQAGRGKIEP